MKKRLEWYAFIHDFNDDKLTMINVLYDYLITRVKKSIKKGSSYDEIKEEVRIMLMSRFRARREYECIVSDLSDKDLEKGIKIDVWYQLEPNLDRIVEYLILNLTPKRRNIKGDDKYDN